jgi:RNA polymerase sigma-70 factor, ECF subfamily
MPVYSSFLQRDMGKMQHMIQSIDQEKRFIRNLRPSDADVVAWTFEDPNVFAVLIERYNDKLGRYVWRLGVARPEDREDILQNVFIATYRNLRSFDRTLSFSSWIYRITHNETMSWFRRSAARPEHLSTFESDDLHAFLKEEGTPAKDAIDKERATQVRAALGELPGRYRDPLALRFFEGKSYEEIARTLQMPIGTVATLVRRGKERLRPALQEAWHGNI